MRRGKPRIPRETSDFLIAVPVHIYIDSLPLDRVILRYMFPLDGTVSSFLIFLGECPIENPRVKVRVITDSGATESFLDLNKGVNRFEETISFMSADRVIMSMEGSEVDYKDIWISFIYKGLK